MIPTLCFYYLGFAMLFGLALLLTMFDYRTRMNEKREFGDEHFLGYSAGSVHAFLGMIISVILSVASIIITDVKIQSDDKIPLLVTELIEAVPVLIFLSWAVNYRMAFMIDKYNNTREYYDASLTRFIIGYITSQNQPVEFGALIKEIEKEKPVPKLPNVVLGYINIIFINKKRRETVLRMIDIFINDEQKILSLLKKMEDEGSIHLIDVDGWHPIDRNPIIRLGRNKAKNARKQWRLDTLYKHSPFVKKKPGEDTSRVRVFHRMPLS